MARRTGRKTAAKEQTTAQRLDRIVKSARRIMRKDKGLNGDLDRLPMLTWIMFLKFLDDMERIEETKAALAEADYRAVIDSALSLARLGRPRRRIDRSRSPRLPGERGGRTSRRFHRAGAVRPGSGTCAATAVDAARRDVVATVFQGFSNRMESGYLLRDVVNLVDGIRFHVSEEVHTLGRLYETLLREMRDAAGDAGEFYTPRPVVRFMVEVTDPRLGETVLDPACGTGGFLTESFDHLMRQAKTEADGATVQERSVFGEEAKTLPYLLAQLNLLLHGLHAPRIDPGNALRHRLTEIGEDRRVNVILTNPPFGGEEEAGTPQQLSRRPANGGDGAPVPPGHHAAAQARRSGPGLAVVVPNGTLFGDGIAARIKADLLESFNLHTIVRLPEGVFAPYTDIPANLIFFDTSEADALDLVLRAAPAGGPQEVLQDGPAHLRGVRALPCLVEGSGDERAGMAGRCGRVGAA